MELCRWLRWKSMQGRPLLDEASLLDAFADNEVPYSCLKTCRPWGPDDHLAAPEICTSERECFEPSPKLVKPTPIT